MSQQQTHDRYFPPRSTLMFMLNVVLHVLQVACLAFLVARNRQGKALTAWSSGVIPNLLSLKFNLLPSVIFKIYNILLAFLTQSLALEQEARVQQTLTDIHDKTFAWMGELQAIVALFQQDWFQSGAFWRISFISLYLLCITVLCTAASSIMTYVWVPGDPTYLNITDLLSNITTEYVKDGYPALSILPVIDKIGLADAFGLWDNTVFDPPYVQDARVDQVSAVRFDVNCQALPNAHQSGSVKVNASTGSITFPFHVDDSLQDVDFTLANRMINIVGANHSSNVDNQLSPLTLLLASTILIADSVNESARSISALDPPLVFSDCDAQNCLSQMQVQILACDMQATFLNISVDGTDGIPADQEGSDSVQRNSTWVEWIGSPVPRNSLETTLGDFVRLSPPSNTRYNIALLNDSTKGTYLQTLLEESVMGDLGVEDAEVPKSSLKLSKVNLSLGRALALVYWRASLTLSGRRSTATQEQSSSSNQGSYKIFANSYTPLISLIASLLAAMLAISLTRPKSDPKTMEGRSGPTGLGVLQMFWRAGINKGEYATQLHSIENPTTQKLRKRGKDMMIPPNESTAPSTPQDNKSETVTHISDKLENNASSSEDAKTPQDDSLKCLRPGSQGHWRGTTAVSIVF